MTHSAELGMQMPSELRRNIKSETRTSWAHGDSGGLDELTCLQIAPDFGRKGWAKITHAHTNAVLAVRYRKLAGTRLVGVAHGVDAEIADNTI